MTADDVMRLRVGDVIDTYLQREQLLSALQEIVRHCPPVPKQPLVRTIRSIAQEAIERSRRRK